MGIPTWYTVGLYWILEHAGVQGYEIAHKLARRGSVQEFVRPEVFLGGSRQTIKRKIKRWVGNQHLAMRRFPGSTQRQARKLISGPSPNTKTRLLPVNRTQSRVVTGLLTGHNTLRRHLYLMGLINNPMQDVQYKGRKLSTHSV
jgi:hypothetical protein